MTGYGSSTGPSQPGAWPGAQGQTWLPPQPPEPQWAYPPPPVELGDTGPALGPTATYAAGVEQTPERPDRKWLRWAVPAAALIVGLGIGVAVGATALQRDPTGTEEYQSLQQELDKAHDDLGAARGEIASAQDLVLEAQADARAAADDAEARSAELDQREADVAAREAAVTVAEQEAAARQVGEGTWTVGVDIEPGTYRTEQPVSGDCYWEITTSGTNGADIIQNDIPGGGIPTVQLSEGQDFTSHRCGTFVRQ